MTGGVRKSMLVDVPETQNEKGSSVNQRMIHHKKRVLGWMVACTVLLCLGWVLSGCSPSGQGCKKSSDCGPGFYCNSSNKCIAGCRLSIECPLGQGCQGNKCFPVTVDKDEDGFLAPIDCDDNAPLINPGANEICKNKKDDNCDGQVDEDGCVNVTCQPGATRECYEGKKETIASGRRCRKGRQTCTSEGKWAECQGQVLPATERCDGVDNDCDGKTDEDNKGQTLTRTCYSASSATLAKDRPCKEGKQTCQKGKWSKCVGEVLPAKEECNGRDDDCDGKVDNPEREGESCKTKNKGECSIGRQTCDKKLKKLVCKQLTAAKDEICDGKDNNCDGVVDDGCPYIPEKISTLSGFPHAVALSNSWAAVSLRDAKKVAIFDIAGKAPKATKEVSVAEAPYGIKVVSDVAYTATSGTIQKVDLVLGKAEKVVSVPSPSHAGQLAELGGRLYTRGWMKDKQTQKVTFSFCRTDPTIPKIDCVSPTGTFTNTGFGVALWPTSSAALLLSDQGVHFIDILSLKDDPKQRFAITADIHDIAVDTSKPIATVIDAAFKKIFLLNLITRNQPVTFDAKGKDGTPVTPNRVISADGFSYVSLSNNEIAVIDLSQNKIIQWIKVGVAPLGMGISPRNGAKGRSVWITCPGDNTIWRFRVP